MLPANVPADHPPITAPRTGILIANLGTPDGYDYWSMRRYLNEFLSDRRVIDYPAWKWQPLLQSVILTKRPFTSGANYKLIWNEEQGESPLMTITRDQTKALRARASEEWGDQVMVEFCMRYGNPSTDHVLDRMIEAGCRRIVFLPLYPQYAGATSATANDQLFRALMKQKWQPSVRTCDAYFDRADYIAALAASVSRVLGDRKPGRLVASYHGMPKRYLLEGDPYHCQCQKTSRLLQEALGWEDGIIDTTFQSVFGPEEWLRPYTVEHVAELAQRGVSDIAVISPAFASDCIETLEEINGEIRESYEHAGGQNFTYIPCLNDDAAHIEVMLNVIRENTGGWVSTD
ncbi:ferrochelatase [Paracoccus tegillarcae]|uniref:Ferrochelatase n=1 Tax=Paracoccus tegillarcae TaxID=1529068 RepID=A0A2K9EPT3_9RHOB|nr:ferrochelatase [Paracoccus tegillarcae]AUH33655.1 ferrochelatase [Paracoccus tegillarcae]